jgi:hypothetical protein
MMMALLRILMLLFSIITTSLSVDVSGKISQVATEVSESTKEVSGKLAYVKEQAEFDLQSAKNTISKKYSALKKSMAGQRAEDPLYASTSSSALGQLPKKNSKSKMLSTLSAHGVKEVLIQEINNMKNSFIPREHIVRHVGTHFPEKTSTEWNDIVISALGLGGNLASEVKKMK